jgi:hypothetical protein
MGAAVLSSGKTEIEWRYVVSKQEGSDNLQQCYAFAEQLDEKTLAKFIDALDVSIEAGGMRKLGEDEITDDTAGHLVWHAQELDVEELQQLADRCREIVYGKPSDG